MLSKLVTVNLIFFCALLAANTFNLAAAQTGTIRGELDGNSFEYAISGEAAQLPSADINLSEYRGNTELMVMMVGVAQGSDQTEGVIGFLGFEGKGKLEIGQVTPSMLNSGLMMIANEWPKDQPEPTTLWIADFDEAETLTVEEMTLSDNNSYIRGAMRSQKFCLHDSTAGDNVPVKRDGALVCKPGEVSFEITIGDAQNSSATKGAEVEVEVLGRLEGTIGNDAYQWMTILPKRAQQSSATFTLHNGKINALKLRGYSPTSEDFKRQDIISINIAQTSLEAIPLNEPVGAEVSFFIDGIGSLYSAQDGSGNAKAVVTALSMNDGLGQATIEVSGHMCRIEDLKLVEGDCKPFEVKGTTEVVLEENQ